MGTAGDFVFPFGKHKGKPLRDIPIGYLDWALGLDDLNRTLRDKINEYLKTQAEYDRQPKDWKEGREDYNPDEDD